MRIALITYEFPPDTGKGGIGTYVKQVAYALAEKGWDVHVFAGSNHRTISERNDEYWVHWLQCNDVNEYRSKVVNNFASQHAIAKFDLMESPEINGNAWEIKRKFKDIPLVVRLHAPNHLVESLKKKYVPLFDKLRYFFGGLRRLQFDLGYWRRYKKEADPDYQFIQLADAITAPSLAMKNWVVKYWALSPGSVNIIPNIFIPPAALLQIPVNANVIYKKIIFFGRLNVLKGLVNATKAMKKILQEYPDWKFKVIGDDGSGPHAGISMRGWMKAKLKPVIEQVEFLDGINYESVPAALLEGEIVLLPSLFESFSYTCIEAMAAGKAIVGSYNGGMADLVENEESGLLIDPENYLEIYTAVKKIINNNTLRYSMAVKARQQVLTAYDKNAVVEKLTAYYEKITCVAK